MQIVIDIPQTTYNHVFDNAGISNNDLNNILLGIYKSVILPSGHGRLIDKDKMIADLLTVDPQYKNLVDWCLRATTAQPTIIEADKAGEEGE